MQLTLDSELEFTPEWRDNATEPEPIVFRLRYLSVDERQRYGGGQAAMNAVLLAAASGKEPDPGDIKVDWRGLFEAGVIEIRNLEVSRGGKVEKITTARQLLALPSFDALFQEVAVMIATMSAIAGSDQGN